MSTTLLLTHLQNPNPNIPLPTLLGALSHHLSVDLPSPAPLAAATVSSFFFLARPYTHEKLQGLVSVFRHAVNSKRQALGQSHKERWTVTQAIFSRSLQSSLETWVVQVLGGLQGGRAVLRLSCLVGLLLGIKDLEGSQGDITQVEDEIVVAVAEVMDAHAQTVNASDWEKEFQPREEDESLSLALILASQSLPLLPTVKLQALPLPLLNYLLVSVVSSAFAHGTFLASLPKFISAEPIQIPKNSTFAHSIQEMAFTPVMTSIAGLSRLTALVLGMLIDSPGGSLREAGETLEMYRQMAGRVEQDWKKSRLSFVENDEEIASDTRDLMKTVWLLLKTLLFSTIMVADGALSNVVYAKPRRQKHQGMPHVTSRSLAETVLRTLFHISFVVSQFGGVIVTAASEDPGFKELRKVFYLAIDVLSSGEFLQEHQILEQREVCERFVRELIDSLRSSSASVERTKDKIDPFERTKTAYVLACIEQLVPLLGEQCLKDHVWGLCVPYLTDPSYRETFESAHSVVLAIFASHAQQQSHHQQKRVMNRLVIEPKIQAHAQVTDRRSNSPTGFILRMIPFYAQCLIENSEDGRLNTPQIRLAYSALVRSASASATKFNSPTHESFELAWYCIELLFEKIRQLTPEAETGGVNERLHRLHLTLISTVPSLPLPLMIRVLDETRNIIVKVEEPREKKELIDALFAEILDNVGDREKEASIRWWYTNRPRLVDANDSIISGGSKSDMRVGVTGQDDQSRTVITSHL